MNQHFRKALEDLDVQLVRKMWAHIAPNMPQPQGDEELLVAVHIARTATTSIELKHRVYSHAWLTERNYPSSLPDHLKKSAERIYPRVVEAVGIAVGTFAGHKELGLAIRSAMSDVVLDAYAEGRKDPDFIKEQMQLARLRVKKLA